MRIHTGLSDIRSIVVAPSNLTVTELVIEKEGKPDEHESTWLWQKIFEAKDLPFHHFLDLNPRKHIPSKDESKDMDGDVHPVVLV
eukprot:CAMPEP_0169172628 /NCGR_PEP_ID=MMETSP1015-20121227/63470_1 /TAXON_ID=342587 /ORGANISM="Karlodinium micrum, Strain CCMP2283" /LENGTH=84 /DNA_ID=CAMNT_0009246145 /DNA_START=12 /DNA_END=262 /DNA_ORIENTATION=+